LSKDAKRASRRDFIKLAGSFAAGAAVAGTAVRATEFVPPSPTSTVTRTASTTEKTTATAPFVGKPNIVFFFVDNLGFGELGCYGGGILRGADTARIDQFSEEGIKLLNFAPEAQCTPSRSALMTGRYSIRSGNQSVPAYGMGGGLVRWERTIAEVLSEAGYATQIVGKWHIGDTDGRWPTDHGFDEWYGLPRTYDECLWSEDPWYNPKRDPVSYVMEGQKGASGQPVKQLTLEVRKNIDTEYQQRAFDFIRRSVNASKPFFLYYCHSMLHLPTVPRDEFKGKSGHGDWADCLMEMDHDFGQLLDLLDELGIRDKTVVVFFGDNGAEETLPWRGTSGFFEGSYFTGSEGSLRTPCIIRWPNQVPAGRVSDEIVHITDLFTTTAKWAGAEIPKDRIIDGIDQGSFFLGKQDNSNRESFIFWNGDRLYGVKWRNWKGIFYRQMYMWDPVETLATPYLYNLIEDPKERENVVIYHSWVLAHMGQVLAMFYKSVAKEPLIPAGAPIDFVPKSAQG
jgi:arylsulfatase A-like enzyme